MFLAIKPLKGTVTFRVSFLPVFPPEAVDTAATAV